MTPRISVGDSECSSKVMSAAIDINAKCREALSLLSSRQGVAERLEALKTEMQQAMVACDPSSEAGRMRHGAILLYLCGLDDLEKCKEAEDKDSRSKLFMAACRKFRSAEMQYEGA